MLERHMTIIKVHFIYKVNGQLYASHRDVFVVTNDYQEAVNIANDFLNGNPQSVEGDGWICTNVESSFSELVISE